MKEPLTTAQLSELTGLIYDAAIDPGRWPIALEAIRVALGFTNTALGLNVFPTGETLLSVTTNVPPEYEATLADYGLEALSMWGDRVGGAKAAAALPTNQPRLLSRVLDYETSTNRMILEWLKPQGIIDELGMSLAMDAHGMGWLVMGRHRDAGPVGDRELEAARLLMPHLQRAVAINRLFDLQALARSTFEKTLGRLAVPVLLTTAGMRLIHANPAAEKLLALGELLLLHNGVVKATTNGAASALSVAVAQAARDEAAIGRKGLGIPAHRKDGTAALLHVLPLRPERLPATNPAVVAIFVAAVDRPPAVSPELIASLFGLTEAEARVFESIAAGRTVAHTAKALGVASSTVRAHLLRLFEKTDTRRQAELVRLAASLAVPVAV